MPCFGRIAPVFQSLHETYPQISQRRDFADEDFWFESLEAMDPLFLGCLRDVAQLSWIVLVVLVPRLLCLPRNRYRFWRLSVLRDATQLWYNFHNSHSIPVVAFPSFVGIVAFFRLFVWLFIKLICTVIEEMAPWLLAPRILLFLDTLRPREKDGSEGVVALWSGFCARSSLSCRKLHWSPFEHWPLSFHW